MRPKKTFVRKKRVTAAQLNDLGEPKVAALFTAMTLSSGTEPSELTSTEHSNDNPSTLSLPSTIANKPAPSAADRKIVLDAVVRIAGYFLNHAKMTQIGDCVLKMAEWGMVEDAKRVMELLKGCPADDGVGSGDEAMVEGERTEVLQAMATSARYLLRYPDMWRDDSAVAEAEEAMVDVVIKVVWFLDGHPAAGRLAVGKEVSEFVRRKYGELEVDGKTWMNG